jgi:aminoglycoside phosphotransferase (APT) family kinase protein
MGDGEPGRLLGAGRSADVYDVGGGRVLRRYRDGRDTRWVDIEAQVMVLVRAAGVPVPEVFDVSGADIVMERVTGPTMLDVMARRPWTAGTQARLLARLHELVRYRLTDPHLLPSEAARLGRLIAA